MAQQQTEVGVVVTAPSTLVTFPVPMDSAVYNITWLCYLAGPPFEWIACDIKHSTRTASNFLAEPSEDALLDYTATEPGLPIGLVVPANRLSRDWDAQRLWREAGGKIDVERHDLINTAVMTVAGVIYALVSSSYMTEQSVLVSGSRFSLGSIRFMMAGGEQKITIDSSLTNYVKFLSPEQFQTWHSGGPQNQGMLVWAYTGENILFQAADDIAAISSLTLRYPRVPIEVGDDSHLIDLPDGAAMSLALLKLKHLVAEREKQPAPEGGRVEARQLLQGLFSNLGVQANLEDIEEKARAIL